MIHAHRIKGSRTRVINVPIAPVMKMIRYTHGFVSGAVRITYKTYKVASKME